MVTSPMMAIALFFLSSPDVVASDTLRSIVRPDIRGDDLQKLEQQIKSMKQQQSEPPPAPHGQPLPEATTTPPPPELLDGDVDPGSPTRPVLGVAATLIKRIRLPVAAGAIAVGVRTLAVRRASAALDNELAALAATCGTRRVDAQSNLRGLRGRQQALAGVRERHALLVNHVLPLRAQLDDSSAAHQLATMSIETLSKLNATLTARVEACGELLAEYEALGQPPPPGFRSWPLEQLRTRLANIESKGALLRTIVALNTRLGGARLDWLMPDWSMEALEEHVGTLRLQAEEATARKEKDTILGKVEAAFWQRNMEVPVATGSLSTDELNTLLSQLKGQSAAPAAKPILPEIDE